MPFLLENNRWSLKYHLVSPKRVNANFPSSFYYRQGFNGTKLQAKNFFTTPVISVFIGVPWFLAVCHIIPYFWGTVTHNVPLSTTNFPVNECFIYYDPLTWTWDYAETLCG